MIILCICEAEATVDGTSIDKTIFGLPKHLLVYFTDLAGSFLFWPIFKLEPKSLTWMLQNSRSMKMISRLKVKQRRSRPIVACYQYNKKNWTHPA